MVSTVVLADQVMWAVPTPSVDVSHQLTHVCHHLVALEPFVIPAGVPSASVVQVSLEILTLDAEVSHLTPSFRCFSSFK